MTAIGEYRHRITVQNPGGMVPDGDGGFTEGWSAATPPEIDASIQRASTRDLERVTAGSVLSTATHLIRCRFHPQLTTNSRLLFRGRVFEVQSAQDIDERQIAMVLICAEVEGTVPESMTARQSQAAVPQVPSRIDAV